MGRKTLKRERLRPAKPFGMQNAQLPMTVLIAWSVQERGSRAGEWKILRKGVGARRSGRGQNAHGPNPRMGHAVYTIQVDPRFRMGGKDLQVFRLHSF